MKKLLAYILCLLPILPLQAGEIEDIFDLANQAYNQQDYQMSIQLYDSLVSMQYSSEELFYNLGNAHYKLNHVAPAILNFERTLRLNPSHEDAIHNLRLANRKVIDNIEALPDLLLVGWFKKLYYGYSSSQWATFAIIILWFAAGGGLLFLFGSTPKSKRLGFFMAIAFLLISMAVLGLSLGKKQVENSSRKAIIFSSTSYVKNAPNGDKDLAVLHEGAKVEVLEESGIWTKIRIQGAGIELEGFVKQEELVEI